MSILHTPRLFPILRPSAIVGDAVNHAVVILQRHFSGAERIVLFRLFCYHGKGLYTISRDSARIFCVISSYKAFTSNFRCRTGYGRRGMNTGRSADFMYVLCAAEWSFRAISYCFVHRRTSRFGSRFGSKRDFKNMVELFDCKMQEKAPKPSGFGAFYGGQYRTRTCDPMHVKHVLIPAELTVHQRDYYSESRWICQALFSRYHAIRRSAASP